MNIVRSNINLTNNTSSIIKQTTPTKKEIKSVESPFIHYKNNTSLGGSTSSIVKSTMPNAKPIKKSPFKPVIVPMSSNVSNYSFVNKYDNIKNNSSNVITKEIITREIIQSGTSMEMPAGTIIQFISSNAPSGWLLCDGTEVLISTYNNLYKIIGNTYGVTSNNNTFKLPDFRGRVPVGAGQGNGLSKRNLGELGGEEKHKLTISEMPIHNHNGTTLNAGNHTHNVNDPGHEHTVNTTAITGSNTVSNTFNKNDRTRIDNKTLTSVKTNKETTDISLGPNGDHTHSFTTNNTGGGQEHNNMQPYIVTNYIIKF